ncbi:MAG: Universal stress protein [Verrucomicrobiales bacterium]|nr:Universal stress protein [Verrucomicrobiales bacterium]
MRIRPLDMTPTKMTIVCGTDFSIHAVEAANVAAMLASRFDDTLALVHVSEQGGFASTTPEIQRSFLANARMKLDQEAARLRKLGPIVREELLTGSPYEKLIEAGHRDSTRMLVISSLGWVAPSHFFVGSVAERTAERSKIPTLVVRGSTAFTAWMRGERPLKIMACYDLAESSAPVLLWINELRQIGPCEITVAYVAWPPHESERLGIAGQKSATAIAPEAQALLERDLKQKVTGILGSENVSIRVIPSWGRPDLPLLDLAGECAADLIVIGSHQREGLSRIRLGSVSRTLLHHSSTSIAVVPLARASHNAAPIPEFKSVLVTTDLSELGNQAIPYAFSALSHGGMVCLLHIPNQRIKRPRALIH